MIYSTYTIGGELFHSVTGKAYKYIDKVRTKSGKWRYIYQKNNVTKNRRYKELDYKNSERDKNKSNKAADMARISKATDQELDDAIDQYRQFFKDVEKGVSKENIKIDDKNRKAYEEAKRDLYLLERERDNRKNGVKFGRRR